MQSVPSFQRVNNLRPVTNTRPPALSAVCRRVHAGDYPSSVNLYTCVTLKRLPGYPRLGQIGQVRDHVRVGPRIQSAGAINFRFQSVHVGVCVPLAHGVDHVSTISVIKDLLLGPYFKGPLERQLVRRLANEEHAAVPSSFEVTPSQNRNKHANGKIETRNRTNVCGKDKYFMGNIFIP